jgi:type IV pilus biogenesis/stability protein PilW
MKQINKKTNFSDKVKHTQPESPQGLSVRPVLSRRLFIFICFFLLTLLVYGNSLKNEFVFDDIPLVVKNYQIRQLNNIPTLLGLGGAGSFYRPLRIVSYAIDYHLFKLNPLGYHLSNMIFHALTAFLVFLTLLRLSDNFRIALAASLLFVVHPVQTDSVTYIAGRRDILSALFYLLGFYLFLRYRKAPSILLLGAILLSYVLAISSKEMAVTFPALCFLYDFMENFAALSTTKTAAPVATRKRIAASLLQMGRQQFFFYAIFLVGACAFVYYKIVVVPPSLRQEYYGGTWANNFLTVSRIIIYYLKLLLFPIALNADYSYNAFPVTTSLLDLKSWASVLALCILFWAGIKAFRHNRLATLCLAWFFITLLPVCHIIPHHELMAEHYLYLPSIGLFFLAGITLDRWLNKKHPYAFLLIAGLLMVFLSVRTVVRNQDWRNALTLWEKTVKTAPNCARAWNNLSVEYYRKGELTKAQDSCQRSFNIKPDFPDPYHNLGNIYADKQLFDRAIEYYKKAYSLCRKGGGKEIINSWGIACRSMGDLKTAAGLFYYALFLDPWYAEARSNMSTVYLAEGNYERAINNIKKAINLEPEVPEYHNNLGAVYRKKGQLQEAVKEFMIAIWIKPDFMEAHNNLGNVLKDQGKYDKAIKTFKRCIALKPDSAEVFTNLGIVYRKANRDQEAIDAFSQALELNPALALPHLHLALIYLATEENNAQALYHLKKTLELDPFLPQAESIGAKISELEENEER